MLKCFIYRCAIDAGDTVCNVERPKRWASFCSAIRFVPATTNQIKSRFKRGLPDRDIDNRFHMFKCVNNVVLW